MPADPVEPLTPWLSSHPYRSIVEVQLGGTADGYALPFDLPERIARTWPGVTSIVGPVHLVAHARFWRPLSHFKPSSYILLPEHAADEPPLLSENAVIELSIAGLLTPGPRGASRLSSLDQVQQAVWRGCHWASGTHIAPPPGRLTLELVRPDGWRQPDPPRARHAEPVLAHA